MFSQTVQLGGLTVSRFILGSNPFSGFSHQGPERDQEMMHFYTNAKLKETLRGAEALGLKTLIARADFHVTRTLLEYWDEGGALTWVAQTCPQIGSIAYGVNTAINWGAKAVYVHGGVMDHLLAQNALDEVPEALKIAHDAGLAFGVAGHTPKVFRWAEDHIDADFYMCSYYNPTSRDQQAEHVSGRPEWFNPADRDAMVATIATLSKPAIHYKVMAAGRNDPADALSFVARHLRPQDAVCVGIFVKDKPDMLAENLRLFEAAVGAGV